MAQTETVTVRLPIAVKQKLEALSASTRRSKSWLAAKAIAAYIEAQSWQLQQIEESVALADSEKAAWVDGEAVGVWLESWGTANEQPTHADNLPFPGSFRVSYSRLHRNR